MVAMHYIGTLQSTGSEFDQSYKRGQPLSFQLGSGRVIKGWDLGLLDMCPGDKRTLTIPPELGYGSRGMGPIPADSTLVFETELVSIGGVPEEPRVVAPEEEGEKKEGAGEKMVEKLEEAAKEEGKEKQTAEEKEAETKKEEAPPAATTEASKAEPAEPSAQPNPQEKLEKEKEEELKKDEL